MNKTYCIFCLVLSGILVIPALVGFVDWFVWFFLNHTLTPIPWGADRVFMAFIFFAYAVCIWLFVNFMDSPNHD